MSSPIEDMVQGVCICCDGDTQKYNLPKYISVLVAKTDPVFNEYITLSNSVSVSNISQLVGMPVDCRKIAPDPSWKWSDDHDPDTNVEVTWLQLIMDTRTKAWMYVTETWKNSVGSVLVTRRDGKLITPQIVEALCAYTIKLYEEEGFRVEGLKISVPEKRKFMRSVTCESFCTFCIAFQEKKSAEIGGWAVRLHPVIMETPEWNKPSPIRFHIKDDLLGLMLDHEESFDKCRADDCLQIVEQVMGVHRQNAMDQNTCILEECG